ncbi:hypothetical protein IU433_12140 [Nocardia puris]|uniref:hypothetical protein n=1 Tax=Nocardia puris TaxID=208602 RepID=UPI001895A545|nr:hypothetical protein [Nocardia puris]MBF6459786.1 hypothetical protein [Nocardia puris]
MTRRALALAPIAVVLLLAGCSGETTKSPSAVETAEGLGTTHALTSPDGALGTVTFTDAIAFPNDCLYSPLPAGTQAIAVRIEVVNATRHEISRPGGDLIGINDAEGFTHESESLTLASDCEDRYPELAVPPKPGKVAGWVVLRAPEIPTALVYTPLVWSEDASLDNFEVVQVEPRQIVVSLPQLTTATPPSSQPPTTTTTEPPAPTTNAAPPPATRAQTTTPAAGVACDVDVDTWAKDVNGGQLRCAFAGGPTAKWVESLPFIGVRVPGSPCTFNEGVAEDAQGRPMVCLGEDGWQPGR